MKSIARVRQAVFVVGLLAARVAFAADGVWTNAVSGNWSDAGKWVGDIPGGGGTAAFNAASGTWNVSNNLGKVTLSGLAANTNTGSGAAWNIVGGTNEMVAPAVIYTRTDSLSVTGSKLSGSTDITVTGPGRFLLGQNNLYTGRTISSNGNIRVAQDSGLGPVPAVPQADAIILDGGGLENDGGYTVSIHTNRGITVTANHGYLGSGFSGGGLVINGAITGPGRLGIKYENNPVVLNNPSNNYSGGTLIGTNGPGINAGLPSTLKLGQSEVLPDGAGKGGLKIGTDSSFNSSLPSAVLDLNGKTETVNSLVSGPRATITSSVASQGRLIIGGLDEDNDYRGTLTGGATVEKRGSGALRLTGAALSGGTVEVKGGTVFAGGPNLAFGSTLLLNGGNLELAAPSGLQEFFGTGGAAINLSAPLTYSGWKLWPEKASENVAGTFVNGRQYVYRGRWNLPQPGTYSFAKSFDDAGYLAIDGTMLISNNVSGAKFVTNDIALAAGWHTVELRVSDGSGAVGPVAANSGFRSGIMYDPTNSTFSTVAQIAAGLVFTDDGGTNLVADGYDNTLGTRLLLAQNATLTVGSTAGKVVFTGTLSTNVVTSPEPVLTVANGGAPLLFGSGGTWPAVLDAAVSSAGGLVFTNRVWLRRLPSGTYSITPGADLALDGTALLGSSALALTNYSVRVTRSDSVGGDGSVTANANTTIWFETMRFANNALTNDASAVLTYSNNVVLNNGTVGFTGAGTVAYSGAITGTGTAVKNGTGDALITGTGSSLNGDFRVDAGRLRPASEAALGGAAVRLNGGRLANLDGQSLTLETTPVSAQGGGFEAVGAGYSLTLNGAVTGVSPVSKWGSGTLVLGGTAINTNFQFYVREGSVELAKSGPAANYAVLDLLGIQTNTLVRLTGSNGNQIGGGVTLDGGTLDLNGISETIGVLNNTALGGFVTNGGTQVATLTVGEGGVSSSFYGRLTDGASALKLGKTGSGTLTLPLTSLAYTGGTRVDGGTLRFTLAPPTAGLSYRLDASDLSKVTLSGSNVTAWADSTTGGVSFTQGTAALQPVLVTNAINGLPAVRFGSGARKRLVANKSVTARTVFIVSRTTGLPSAGLSGIWGQDGQDSGVRHNNSTSWRHTGNGADGGDFSNGGQMYINGVAGFSFAGKTLHVLTAVSTTDRAWTTALGDYWNSGSYLRYFIGEVGEVLVYNTVLSVADRQTVEAYLNAKWVTGFAVLTNQPVTVESGARLAVTNMNLSISTLTGSGALVTEGGSTVTLPVYEGFTGTVSGAGMVVMQATNGMDGRFLPQDIGTTVRNNGTLAAVLRVDKATTNVFSGMIQDGSRSLGITQSGTGVTYYSGTNSTYTGATRIEAGMAVVNGATYAKFVRFSPTLMRGGSVYEYQIDDFDLMFDGLKTPYPAGTTAYTPSGKTGGEGPDKAIDGSTSTKFYTSTTPMSPLVIVLSKGVFFDGYRWFTGNDSTQRDPVNWIVETSPDGTNWTVVDSRTNQTITTSRNVLAGAYDVAQLGAMNVFSDVSATTVASPGVLAVSRTRETVGSLSGDGIVRLSAAATLGINSFAEAAFSGGITGTGTVVKTGAARQTLSGTLAFTGTITVESGVLDLEGAILTGVTNIVIKTGGELTGAATVNGNLTVTFEGGLFSGSLAVSGVLTVTGPVKLAMPAGATYPFARTLFSYASADQATRDALAAAIKPSPVPTGHAATVRVTATSARLIVAPVGSVISIR